MTSGLVISYAVAAVCLLVVAWFVRKYLHLRSVERSWVRVQGTVRSSWKESDTVRAADMSSNITTHHAEYDYWTPDGQLRHGTGQTEELLEPGSDIEIQYDPRAPDRSETAVDNSRPFLMVAIPVALLFLAIAALAIADHHWGVMS